MKNRPILTKLNRLFSNNNYIIITKRHFTCYFDYIKYNAKQFIMNRAGFESSKIRKFSDLFKNSNCSVNDLKLNNVEIFYTFLLRSFIISMSYFILLFLTIGIPIIIIAINSPGGDFD